MFQVLLSNTNNSISYSSFVGTHLNVFKYGKWLSSFIRPIDWTPTGFTISCLSGPGSNGNEGVLYILQSSRIGASLSDV